MKDLLKQIILEQHETKHVSRTHFVQRHIADEWLETTEILIISGIRRCGKSVLMQQIRDRLQEKDFFFNFDDERLAHFKLDNFQTLQCNAINWCFYAQNAIDDNKVAFASEHSICEYAC